MASRLFYIPASVGGRFSELCPVGLLPAAVCGIDIRDMLEGAARHGRALHRATTCGRTPPCWKRCCMYIAMQDMGMNMSRHDALCRQPEATWPTGTAQLWAESPRQERDPQGHGRATSAPTPIKTLGVTDQHSQLQLYTEGPLRQGRHLPEGRVTSATSHAHPATAARMCPDVAFLGGKSHNQLIEAERRGTEYALYQVPAA